MNRNKINLKIYIEGADKGKSLRPLFQEAWTKFFQAAGLKGKMPRIVTGRGRGTTFDLFSTAIQNRSKEEIPILLVDSEDSVNPNTTIWQHLKARDGWERPSQASNEHVYLMVHVMETWFLADLATLQTYFGSKFKPDKIPAWRDLENQPKSAVFKALENATAECEKKYAKGKVSFEILGEINPQKVKEHCPNAKRLLDFLAST